MSASAGSKNRDVVPNWRPISRATKTGELESKNSRDVAVPSSALSEQEEHFRNNGGLFSAIDLVGAADALGMARSEVISEALDTIRSARPNRSVDHLLTGAINLRLDGMVGPFDQDREVQIPDLGGLRTHVSRLKHRLQSDPRDVMSLVDLSLRYLSLGQTKLAVETMDRALALAPENRYVLRASSRLFIHIGDLSHATQLLRRPAEASADPWLLAPLFAASEMDGKPVGNLRLAREVLSDSSWSHRARAELASEMGTLELRAGHAKRGHSLIDQSLLDPNDNALAQAAWAQDLGVIVGERLVKAEPQAFEARARQAAHIWQWNQALFSARAWVADQPFSTAAGAFIGWVAATADSGYQDAAAALRLGLEANPRDSTLLNNLAFAEIQLGDLDTARDLLYTPARDTDDLISEEVITATRGLLAFREGNLMNGRTLYAEAIKQMQVVDQPIYAATAFLFWGLEEIASPLGDVQVAANALESTKSILDSSVQYLRERVLTRLGPQAT